MKSNLLLVCISFLLFSCTASQQTVSSANKGIKKSLRVTSISDNSDYGVTEKEAIKVGVGAQDKRVANEYTYLGQLAGPNGENISFNRTGSCCAFETPNGMMGGGLLDRYEVTWKGQKEPVYIYINMYDPPKEDLKAPKGFTIKE